MGLRFCQGRFSFAIQKNLFTRKSCQVLEQAAQKSGAVTIPRGIEKMWHLVSLLDSAVLD